ncbi:oligosaccharide flippase family protein [Frondihabitans cladoniiphilus]|uniref:O-antigen/teichoic acid export membrane protein n=1 Tax=Frondihabitans cladoniiphilus TaxID=715785 RepID=A0ABP8W1K5_9MICO
MTSRIDLLGRLRRHFRVMGLYTLAPVAAGLAPLAVIPAVTGRFGAEGWSVVAVSLAVGSAASVIAELGWTIVGPQLVARASGETARLYEEALASRLVALAFVLPIGLVVTVLTTEHHLIAACLITAGVTSAAVNPAWLFTGLGRPTSILVADTLPRVALCLLSALVITAGGPLEVYGLALLGTAVVGLVAASRMLGVPLCPRRHSFAAVPRRLKEQGMLVLGRGVTTVYKALPVVVLSAISPGAVAAYSALDRPLRMGLGILIAVPNRLQSWAGVADGRLRSRRVRVSLVVNAALGLAGGLVFAAGIPLVTAVLFRGVVTVDAELTWLGAAVVAAACLSRGFGFALVVDRRANATAVAAFWAAGTAVVCLPLGAVLDGATGLLLGVLAAELVGVLAQAFLWARSSRTGSRSPAVRERDGAPMGSPS